MLRWRVLVAYPSLPARNIPELIELARKRPGELSYGSSGIAATPHLSAEYFKAAAKVNINHVPYKGAGPMYLDLFWAASSWAQPCSAARSRTSAAARCARLA